MQGLSAPQTYRRLSGAVDQSSRLANGLSSLCSTRLSGLRRRIQWRWYRRTKSRNRAVGINRCVNTIVRLENTVGGVNPVLRAVIGIPRRQVVPFTTFAGYPDAVARVVLNVEPVRIKPVHRII